MIDETQDIENKTGNRVTHQWWQTEAYDQQSGYQGTSDMSIVESQPA